MVINLNRLFKTLKEVFVLFYVYYNRVLKDIDSVFGSVTVTVSIAPIRDLDVGVSRRHV